MSKITEYLQKILSARYGRDVRQAIHDGIQQCYEDGKSGAVDLVARQGIESLEASIDTAYANSNAYTDQKIADLINGAPNTLDTLKEIADAMAENEEVVEALEASIGSKANQAEMDTHTGNSTIHITASERANWNAKADSNHTHDPQSRLRAENGNEAVMQNDTNIVVYDSNGNAIWASKTPVSWSSVQNIESGVASVTPTATNTTKTVWVSFTRTFTEIPHVVVTPQTSAPNVCYASVTNIAKTGFNVNLYRTDSTNATQIHWMAMV